MSRVKEEEDNNAFSVPLLAKPVFFPNRIITNILPNQINTNFFLPNQIISNNLPNQIKFLVCKPNQIISNSFPNQIISYHQTKEFPIFFN